MRRINRDDKILSISHSDADGVAAQVVLGNVFKNIKYLIYQFVKIDDALNLFDFSPYDHVFLTDIYPSVFKIMDRTDKLIFLDHHDTSKELHDPKKMRFVDTNQCAASLTKNFVEAYFKIKLSHLDKFIYYINDYDLWLHRDPFSRKFNLLYDMYRGVNRDLSKYRERFMNGNVLLSEEEAEYIAGKEREYTTVLDGLEMIEFNHIKGAFVINAPSFINEISHDLMNNNGYRIVFIKSAVTDHISVRHNVESLNMGELLTKNNIGGGHPKAAGMSKMENDKLIKILLTIEKYLYLHYPEMRRS